jgi:predicted permease
VFGLLPALQATKLDLQGALKDQVTRLSRWDLRRGLAAAQVALCVVILSGAGLLLRGLVVASQSDSGFDTRRLAVLHLDLRLFAYDQPRALSMMTALREKLLSLPGVEGVTYIDVLPYGNNSNSTDLIPVHRRVTIDRAHVSRVGFDHHQMMNIQLVAGRAFTRNDLGKPVAIINEAAARMAWGNEDPIGKTFNKTLQVVGVARNSVYRSLESKLLPGFFLPVEANLDSSFLVRLRDPRQVGLIRDAVRAIDPRVIPAINLLEEDMHRSFQPARMSAGIALGLGVFALILACVGLYGVVAYHVTQRTREIGVRMALGARPREVTRLVLGQNLKAVFVGVVIGIGAAASLSKLLRDLIYGLSTLDPIAYLGVVVCLVVAVLAASIVPARRAAAVDPMTALRTE